MELVYLWVEEYKNIYHQGFNFSPKFKCDYNEEKEELTITENKDCVSIFPKNINITAIVGENGSGKSTICNSLITSQKGIIRIYKLDANFYYFDSKVGTVNYPNNFKKLISEEIEQVKFSYDFFSQPFINDALSHSNRDFIWSENNIFNDIFDYSYESIDLVKYKSIVGKAIYQYGKIITTLSEFKYEKIIFTLRIDNYFDIKKRERLNESIKISTSFTDFSFEDIFKNLTICQKFLLYIIYLINEEKILRGEPDWLSDFTTFDEILDNHSYYLKLTDNPDIRNLIENYDEYCRFLTLFESSNTIVKDSDLLLDELLFSRNFYSLLELNYYDSLERQYDKLSHGERQIHSSMLLLYDKIINSEKKYFEIILDEIENSLHPMWQKTLISELIKLCKTFEYKKIHFIITSHSPFILSDLPKENVIFLKNGKIDNPDIKQTFGANIHTLLSDGFFMSDGLMGEFAKSKISEIKKFYELIQNLQNKGKIKNKNLWKKSYERRKTRFENIQKIIGEPFLQTIIKNYLDDLYLTFSDDKTLIDKELIELEKKKAYLESLKNGKN